MAKEVVQQRGAANRQAPSDSLCGLGVLRQRAGEHQRQDSDMGTGMLCPV